MYLSKDGITVEVTHPSDIGRYKLAGYKEVVAAPVKAETSEAEAKAAREAEKAAKEAEKAAKLAAAKAAKEAEKAAAEGGE